MPVTDPLMSWANEAHWSMGGLSFKRLRLQGKIEGNVNKLRAEREKLFKKLNCSPVAIGSKSNNVSGSKRAASVSPPPAPVAAKRRRFLAMIEEEEESAGEEEVETGNRWVRRRLVKKLGDDFDKVALENERSEISDSGNRGEKGSPLKGSGDRSDSMVLRTRSRKFEKRDDDDDDDADDVMKVVEEVKKWSPKGKNKAEKNTNSQVDKSPVSVNRIRTSPRLSNRRSR